MRVNFLYHEGKRKALTFSYDDGCIHDKTLIGIFEQYGMKGTFNLNSGLFGTHNRIPEDEICEVYKNHEIACHTLHHETLPKLSLLSALEEILEDKKNLERITSRIIRGFVYPYGARNTATENLVKTLGFAYARKSATSSYGIPDDFFQWQTTCHHNAELLQRGETFLHLQNKLPLLFVWGHSCEFNDQNNWFLIEDFCRKMAHKGDIWYASNIEICDYLLAAKQIQTSADGRRIHNPTALTLWGEWDNAVPFKIAPGETLEYGLSQ